MQLDAWEFLGPAGYDVIKSSANFEREPSYLAAREQYVRNQQSADVALTYLAVLLILAMMAIALFTGLVGLVEALWGVLKFLGRNAVATLAVVGAGGAWWWYQGWAARRHFYATAIQMRATPTYNDFLTLELRRSPSTVGKPVDV